MSDVPKEGLFNSLSTLQMLEKRKIRVENLYIE